MLLTIKDEIKKYRTYETMEITDEEYNRMYEIVGHMYDLLGGIDTVKKARQLWDVLSERQKYIMCNPVSRDGIAYFNLGKYF